MRGAVGDLTSQCHCDNAAVRRPKAQAAVETADIHIAVQAGFRECGEGIYLDK